MIRKGADEDFEEIFNIINDAAIAYKGVIPPDRWHEPYMTKEELKAQIEDGVRFSCYVDNNEIIGVMGIQDKTDVELIRHAYVRTKHRNKGIGTLLIRELIKDSTKPILVGTWKAANLAISFYEKHGFWEHPNFARRQENGEFIRENLSRIKGDYADVALTATI